MSNQRYIDVSFWDDAWVQELDPSEKLLYMYLLTNPLTNIAGVYQITRKRICFDTGFNSDTVGHILSKFEKAGKVYTFNDYIIIKNWCKHQKVECNNSEKVSNVKIGIDRILKELPNELLEFLYKIDFSYIYLKNILISKGLEGACKDLELLRLNLDLDLTNTSAPNEQTEIELLKQKLAEQEMMIAEQKMIISEKETAISNLSSSAKASEDVISQKSVKKTKNNTPSFPKSDYDEVFNTHTSLFLKLYEQGKLKTEKPYYDRKRLMSTLKGCFSNPDIGKDKVIQAIKNSVNDKWAVEDIQFNLATLLSSSVIGREYTCAYFNPYDKLSSYTPKRQSAFVSLGVNQTDDNYMASTF